MNDDVEAGLRLQLKDFATESLVGSDKLDDLIFIPASTLCSYLEEAEQNMAKLSQNQRTTKRQWVGKRRRQRTPPEECHVHRVWSYLLHSFRCRRFCTRKESVPGPESL